MATGAGVNVSKGNTYSVVTHAAGVCLSKSGTYSVLAAPLGLALNKTVVYSVLSTENKTLVSKALAYSVLVEDDLQFVSKVTAYSVLVQGDLQFVSKLTTYAVVVPNSLLVSKTNIYAVVTDTLRVSKVDAHSVLSAPGGQNVSKLGGSAVTAPPDGERASKVDAAAVTAPPAGLDASKVIATLVTLTPDGCDVSKINVYAVSVTNLEESLPQSMARHGAVAPIMLLDVLTLDGTAYHWASAPIPSAAALSIPVLLTGNPPAWNAFLRVQYWNDAYLPWLLTSGPFHLSRSMQSDIGNFTVQNVSGNTMQRSMAEIVTADAFEGAVFAYREWNLDAARAEFEFHGQLSVVAITETIVEFAAEQLFNPSSYQGLILSSEQCPWRYGSAACGDTTNNPCENSWLTCRQPSRFGGIVESLINVQPPAFANPSTRNVVRNRQI